MCCRCGAMSISGQKYFNYLFLNFPDPVLKVDGTRDGGGGGGKEGMGMGAGEVQIPFSNSTKAEISVHISPLLDHFGRQLGNGTVLRLY